MAARAGDGKPNRRRWMICAGSRFPAANTNSMTRPFSSAKPLVVSDYPIGICSSFRRATRRSHRSPSQPKIQELAPQTLSSTSTRTSRALSSPNARGRAPGMATAIDPCPSNYRGESGRLEIRGGCFADPEEVALCRASADKMGGERRVGAGPDHDPQGTLRQPGSKSCTCRIAYYFSSVNHVVEGCGKSALGPATSHNVPIFTSSN